MTSTAGTTLPRQGGAVTGTLTELRRFPVKSMRGHHLADAAVEPWGLAGDRRWMVVDPDGRCVTARDIPRMLLVTPALRPDGGLVLSAPGVADHRVPVPEAPARRTVSVWRSILDASSADPATDRWLSDLLGRPLHLVHQGDPHSRTANPDFAGADAPVSLADGYPLLVVNRRSLDALNDEILLGPRSDEGPMAMTRFRPNLVIDGPPPWSEDGWRRLRIGETVFRAVKGCARCVMTTTDPDTAARGKEPIATLARIRRFDRETWFGMNLVPESPGRVRVGDDVEVLEAVPAPDGPPR